MKSILMKRKELYKLINEEIGNFDFLGNSEMKDELSHEQVVSSKDFQTKLIHELLTNSEIISNATYINKDSNVDEYPSVIELELEINFTYEERDYVLILLLDGEEDSNNDFDIDSFNLKLFSKGGEEINIDWVKRNSNIFSKLIESLLAPYL